MEAPRQRIESLDDPRVADYCNVRDRDLLGRRGVFMGEGEGVLRTMIDLAASPQAASPGPPLRLRSVLLTPTRLAALSDELDRLPPDVPILVAEPGVMDDIAGFHIHRGVLGAGERWEAPEPAALIRTALDRARRDGRAASLLVLEDLANHDNVGGVFRNAGAFGVDGVLLTRRSCDPLYRKAIRVSMGNALRLPWAWVDDAAQALALLRAEGVASVALTPRSDAASLSDIMRAQDARLRGHAALLLGAEGPGLSEGAISGADVAARIDIEAAVDSLNVASACAVGLFALGSARQGC